MTPATWYRAWLVLGWCQVAIVLTLCLMPAPPQPPLVHSDKAHHLLAFAALMLWFRWKSRTWWLPGVALVGLGILIEILQGTCTTTRCAEVGDVVADSCGVLAGEALIRTPAGHLLRRLDSWLTHHDPP